MELPRLTPASRRHTEGPGYVAIVFQGEDEQIVAFDSFVEHLKSGVFKTSEDAEMYAGTWKAGRVAQIKRRLELQMQRGLALGPRTMEISRAIVALESNRKDINAEIVRLKAEHLRLAAEATDPVVDLVCTPSAGWSICDGPADRQQALDLEPEPQDAANAVEHLLAKLNAKTPVKPTEPAAKPAKLPSSVPGSEGPRLKPDMRVHVEQPGDAPWVGTVLSISRQDDAGAYWLEVTDSAGAVHEVNAAHCRKAKKGEG